MSSPTLAFFFFFPGHKYLSVISTFTRLTQMNMMPLNEHSTLKYYVRLHIILKYLKYLKTQLFKNVEQNYCAFTLMYF